MAGRSDVHRNHGRCAGSPAAEGSKAIVVDIHQPYRFRGWDEWHGACRRNVFRGQDDLDMNFTWQKHC